MGKQFNDGFFNGINKLWNDMSTLSVNEIYLALEDRYPKNAWAFFSEVRNGTGYSRAERYADGLAMSLWPSRGIDLHGIEIKVSRSDWLSELKQPEKADAICQYCDYWWVAVGDAEIVKLSELPSNWGLLIPRGEKLYAKVDAPKLTAKPLDRLLVASILRKAQSSYSKIPESLLNDAVNKKVKNTTDALKDVHSRAMKYLQNELDQSRADIANFEKLTGAKINRWDNDRSAAAVKFIMQHGNDLGTGFARKQIKEILYTVSNIHRNLTDQINELDKLENKKLDLQP